MKISRKRVLEILKHHGFESNQPTAYSKNGDYIWASTFDASLGVREEYSLNLVREWLGY